MLKVGDTVKVISKTECNGKMEELIKIGTICKVLNVYNDFAEVVSLKNDWEPEYCYLFSELEKGHLEWVKD